MIILIQKMELLLFTFEGKDNEVFQDKNLLQ